MSSNNYHHVVVISPKKTSRAVANSSLFTLHSSLKLGFLHGRASVVAAAAALRLLGERLDVGKAGLVGHQAAGVLALLRLVGEEADHDRLEAGGVELILIFGALAATGEIEGAQSVELQLVALQEQLLEAVDELLHHALDDVGGVDGAVLLDVTADVVGDEGTLADKSSVGLTVGVGLAVLVLVRAIIDLCHNRFVY